MRENGVNPYYWPIPNTEGHWNIPAHKMIGQEITNHMIAIINAKKNIPVNPEKRLIYTPKRRETTF